MCGARRRLYENDAIHCEAGPLNSEDFWFKFVKLIDFLKNAWKNSINLMSRFFTMLSAHFPKRIASENGTKKFTRVEPSTTNFHLIE